MITLLDYGAGNVRSVVNAIEKSGHTVHMAASGDDIARAEKLVFPGVGNFGKMMQVLGDKGFVEPLLTFLRADKPFLGICLGLHALFEKSHEAPGIAGLGFFTGEVRRFETELSVPHIGWNGICVKKPTRLFTSLAEDEKFYFVHSYHVVPQNPDVVLTRTDYGQSFVSSVAAGNIAATQFHPEKSGAAGLAVLRNFLEPGPEAAIELREPVRTHLAKRIVACLDVRADDAGQLVVTKGDHYDVREKGQVRDLGGPVELARDYYAQGADEITFLNITGFRDFPMQDMPMLDVLRRTSEHVFVPLTIGGGIRSYTDADGRRWSSLEVAAQYFRSGADKISIGSDAVYIAENYLKTGKKTGDSAIEQISGVYGSQAVVISVDPRRVYVHDPADAPGQVVIETAEPDPEGRCFCWFQCTVSGGRQGRPVDAVTLARVCQALGAGEILLNSIDRDGTGAGFDLELISAVCDAVSIPVIASSGAGSAEHFLEVFTRTNVEAALAAGIFHRKQVPLGQVKQYLQNKVEIRREGI